MTHRYTVIGQPVAHSLSPLVHQQFAEQTQRAIEYTRTESTPESFHDTVLTLQQSGLSGCNVTAPFKEQAASLCHRLSAESQLCGSVNTIDMQVDGSLSGHTTDGKGLVVDVVSNHQHELKDQRILILGAGGAVRGILGALLEAAPACIHIANRTASRASELAELFDGRGQVIASGFEQLADSEPFHLIINAVSLTHTASIPVLPDALGKRETLAYDMNYAAGDTAFMQWAAMRGMQVANGIGMLVEQAAESFAIWEGVRPDTGPVYPKLRQLIEQQQ